MNTHPLARHLGFCLVVPDFLSREECRAFIAKAEARGFTGAGTDYPPSYRNNERLVVDDPALAAAMTLRLREHLEPTLASDDHHGRGSWTLDGVNERFRFCRYRASQAFHIHQDGVHHRGGDVQSRLTFMIYLTDGDEFDGGDTLFFAGGPATTPPGEAHPPVVARVRPRAGSLIVFDHGIWHAGDVVTRGTKHIMRSDVMYRRTVRREPVSAPFSPSHQGYVWTLCALPEGRIASGGRDSLIRLWTSEGAPQGQLRGHKQSVLGFAMLDDGRLASVARDRSLRLWDLSRGVCERIAEPHAGAILSVAAWQAQVASGGADGAICLTDASSGEVSRLASGAGWIWSLAVSHDGLLAAASEDGDVLWRDLRRPDVVPFAPIHAGAALRSLDLSADGQHLVTGDISGAVSYWWRQGGAWIRATTWQAHAAAVRRVRWGEDAQVWSAGEDGKVRRWRVGAAEPAWEAAHANFATDVLPLDDGAVLSCAYDGLVARHAEPASARCFRPQPGGAGPDHPGAVA